MYVWLEVSQPCRCGIRYLLIEWIFIHCVYRAIKNRNRTHFHFHFSFAHSLNSKYTQFGCIRRMYIGWPSKNELIPTYWKKSNACNDERGYFSNYHLVECNFKNAPFYKMAGNRDSFDGKQNERMYDCVRIIRALKLEKREFVSR